MLISKLKQLNRLYIFIYMALSVLFGCFLLLVRMERLNSTYYLFLIWNIFLAGIPLAISTMLILFKKLNKTLPFLFLSVIWLLFLPNAPYILTDLMHLKYSSAHTTWFDVPLILNFAILGLFMFFFSLQDMQHFLTKKTGKWPSLIIIVLIIFLSAFGVYLGRFLRFNSWEFFTQPIEVIKSVFHQISNPTENYKAYGFTIVYGVLFVTIYFIFRAINRIKYPEKKENAQ